MAITKRTARILLVIATCLWTLAGGASLMVVMFVPMLFDAPGADGAPPIDVLDGGVRPASGALPVRKKCCRADALGIYTSGK